MHELSAASTALKLNACSDDVGCQRISAERLLDTRDSAAFGSGKRSHMQIMQLSRIQADDWMKHIRKPVGVASPVLLR